MVRLQCIDYLQKNKAKTSFNEKFEDFDIKNWDEYCNEMKLDETQGTQIELIAISEVFNTNLQVFSAFKGLNNPEIAINQAN